MKNQPELKILNVKLTVKERNAMLRLAKKYTKGNISAWIRYASLRYVPKKSEEIPAILVPKQLQVRR